MLFSTSSEVCVPIDCHSMCPRVELGAGRCTRASCPSGSVIPSQILGLSAMARDCLGPQMGPALERLGAAAAPL